MQQNPDGSTTIGHYLYRQQDQLGRGYSSIVYRGIDCRNQQTVAIKVVDIRQLQDQLHRQLLQSEIQCLTRLRGCNNIVQLLDVISTQHHKCLVMEFCQGGDLNGLIVSSGGISQQQTVRILKQLINGLNGMWKAGIVHRDFKPANIFLKQGNVKIADFGFAIDASHCSKPFSYNIGSPSYMSPQALRRNQYSFLSDVWALGVIAFELVFGRVPYKTSNDMLLYQTMVNESMSNIIMKNKKISGILSNFICDCCSPSLKTRLTPDNIKNYDWNRQVPSKAITMKSMIQNGQGGLHGIFRQARNRTILGQNNTTLASMTTIMHSPRNNTNVTRQNTNTTIPNLPAINSSIEVTMPLVSQPQLISPKSHNLQFHFGQNLFSPRKASDEQFRPRQSMGTSVKTQVYMESPKPSSPVELPVIQQQTIVDPDHVQNCLISQLHYCRYLDLVLRQLQNDDTLHRYIRQELLQRIQLLLIVVNEKTNILELSNFSSFLQSDKFDLMSNLITKYHAKYNQRYTFDNWTDRNNLQNNLMESLEKSIRILAGKDDRLDLLQKLVTLFQLKNLEKKTDYNNFMSDSKIDMLMEKPNPLVTKERLKNRIQLLGIC